MSYEPPNLDVVNLSLQEYNAPALTDVDFQLGLSESESPELISATLQADGETVILVFDRAVNSAEGAAFDIKVNDKPLVLESGDGTDTLTCKVEIS